MPQVITKTKNKAGQPYPCDRCSEKIVAGQKYYQWSFRYAESASRAADGDP